MTCLYLCCRENDGGMGAAEFISKLLLSAPGLIKLDASYNALPAEAMAMIGSSVKSANGTLSSSRNFCFCLIY